MKGNENVACIRVRMGKKEGAGGGGQLLCGKHSQLLFLTRHFPLILTLMNIKSYTVISM